MGIEGISLWGLLTFIFVFAVFGLLIYLFYLLIKLLVTVIKSTEGDLASSSHQENISLAPSSNSQQHVNHKLIASSAYAICLTDVYVTQLSHFYQLYLFGYKVCLITLIPLIILIITQRDHSHYLVRKNVRLALRTYLIYVLASILNGVLLSNLGNDFSYLLVGISISFFMLLVVLWFSVVCVLGFIRIINSEEHIEKRRVEPKL